MILRTKKPGNMSWARVVGEGAAIVVGILLAFAIDAWWEERELRIEEQQVLEGLREEFISIHEVLSQHLLEHRQEVGWLEEFLVTADTSSAEEAGPIVDAVAWTIETENLGPR